MIFNFAAFDSLFQDVVTKSSDSFNFLVLRPIPQTDPETRTTTTTLKIIDSGVANWDVPMERTQYQIEGRVATTDVIFFATGEKTIRQGDMFYRFDTGNFYDVLGKRDFSSHFELDCCYIAMGFNSSISGLSPELPYLAEFIENDLAAVS